MGGGLSGGFHAIVLAAGSGSRFGGGKLMTPWRGGVLIDGALAAARAAPVRDVRVVTGADPAVAAHVAGLPDVIMVASPDHALGLSRSLRAGIASLPADAAGALIFLGDMPLIPHAVLAPLVEALAKGAPAAVPVWQGREGHPAALSAGLFARVLGLDGDRGARAVLEALGEQLILIGAPDAGILLDVDRSTDVPL